MKKITLLVLFLSTLWGYSQVKNYKFSQTSGVYTEISGGTVLGNESSDAQFFVDAAAPLGSASVVTGVGLPIGFNFTFNGYVYDKFAVSTDGWISLGSSALTPNKVDCNVSNPGQPLSSTVAVTANLSSKIAALGIDLMAQTGSSITYKTIGTSPNQVLVVQWKGFKKGGAIGTGDNFNFQIRLNETTNKIDFVYGGFICNNTYLNNSISPIPVAQVGLRSEPAATVTNFVNRNSTTGWANTTLAGLTTDNVVLNGSKVPSSGLTFTWSPPACGSAVTYLFEDFDNYPGTSGGANTPVKALPDCWSNALSTGTTSDSYMYNLSTATPMSVPNRLLIKGDATLATVSVANVVLPAMSNLSAGTNRLRFKAYAGTANKTIELGYLDSTDAVPTFHSIQTITIVPTSIATSAIITITPTGIPVTATNLVFKNSGYPIVGTTPAGPLTVYIDDLVWEPIPAVVCTDVSAITIKGNTSNSIALSWTKGASDTAWQYAYGTADSLNPNTLSNKVDVDSSSASGSTVSTTVNGLSAATNYKVWVRSKCTDGSFGTWVGPFIFSTTNAPVAQFMENFDASLSIPSTWSKVPNSLGNPLITVGSASYEVPSSPNYLLVPGSGASPSTVIALPPVSNLGAGTHQLKFKVKGNGPGIKLEIGYLDDISNANTFHTIDNITTWADQYSFESKVRSFGQVPGATQYLAFRNPGVPSGPIYIDNVVWEPLPTTCQNVSNFTTTSVLSTSVGLSWNTGGNTGETWQYAITDSNIASPYSLTPVDITSTTTPSSTTIEGLIPATAYKVWLRSKCTDGSFGSWTQAVSFTTTCYSNDGFAQNFNTASSTVIPSCWQKISGFASISTLTIATPNSPGLSMTASSITLPAIWAAPPVSNLGSGVYRVKFVYGSSLAGGILEVGYLTNPSDPNSFNQIAQYTAVAAGTAYPITLELGKFQGSEVLAFRNRTTGTASLAMYVDDVVVEQIPACADITNLAFTGSTSDSVTIDWDNAQGQNLSQYVIAPSAVKSPFGLTITDVTPVSEVVIGQLSPYTEYNVWVRSKCVSNNDGLGTWQGPLLVKTTCTPIGGFFQKFNDMTYLPDCWSRVGTGGTLYFNPLGSPKSDGNIVGMGPTRLPSGTFTSANPMVISMPPINNANNANQVLKFMYSASQIGSVIEVGYLTNIFDPTSFTACADPIEVDSKTELKKAVIKLKTPVLSTVLAFRNGSENLAYVFIDDVYWGPQDTQVPLCTTATATVDANCGNYTTDISWSAVSNADGYKLTIGTTPGGHEVLNERAIYKLNYSFLGDLGKTYYYTVKPFNAVGNAVGCAEKTFVTNANGCYCKSVPSGKIGKTITDIQLGATNFKGGSGTTADFTAIPVNLDKSKDVNLKLTFDTRQTSGYGPWQNVKVFVDFNRNFNYEDSETVFTGIAPESTEGPVAVDAIFHMPAVVDSGLYSMRIVAVSNTAGVDAVTACYNGNSGMTLDFKLNLVTPIENDAPSGALPLTVGKTFAEYSVTGTTVNATGSSIEAQPGCGGYKGMDVWYKAVVPTSGFLIFEINSVTEGLKNTAVAAYSGTPVSLSLIGCDDSSSTMGDDHPRLRLSGRTAGEVVYFRVWENGGDASGNFKVSVYSNVPQAVTEVTSSTNENCGNYATQISWSAAVDAAGYKLSVGTTSGTSNVVNNQDLGNVLTYSFMGNSNTTYFYTLIPFNANGDAVGNVERTFKTTVNNCFCTSVPTSKDGPGIANVQIGATNFVNPNDIYHDFTEKTVNVSKGENTNLKMTFATGGVSYHTNIWIDYNDNSLFENSEIVFTGVSQSSATSVLDGTFEIPSNASLGTHRMRIGATRETITPANPCYNGSNGVTLDFNVKVVNVPVNDKPLGAVTLTVGKVFADYAISGTNTDATGSIQETAPDCGNYNGSDVWYKAVVPASGKITFEVNSVEGGIINTAAAIYTNSLNLVYCDDSSSIGNGIEGDHPKISLIGRPVGENLYFRVWENGGDTYGNYLVSAYENAALGIDTFNTANFTYYPNPVIDVLNISLDQEITNVVVSNMLGQQVLVKSVNANQIKLDMSDLPKGSYLVKVSAGSQSKTIKAVKE